MSGMKQPVSAIRSRDKALDLLLPKFLWIVCSLGTPSGTGRKRGVKAIIDAGLELHASPLRPYRIVASVYALTERAPLYKVFSVHLAVASAFVDPQFFTYQAGRCGILSWKRGIWEDRIVAAACEPGSMENIGQLLSRLERGLF